MISGQQEGVTPAARAGQEGRKGALQALLPATVRIQCLPREPDNVGWSALLELAPRPQLCSREWGLRVYCKLGQRKEALVNVTGKLQNQGFSIQTWSGTFMGSEVPRA